MKTDLFLGLLVEVLAIDCRSGQLVLDLERRVSHLHGQALNIHIDTQNEYKYRLNEEKKTKHDGYEANRIPSRGGTFDTRS